MDFSLRTPAEQISLLMTRLYQNGLTTTTGGNLSIKDEDNNLWISPAGIDKGTLTPDDIMCVQPDGTVIGRHRPSSEHPFHRMLYDKRPDVSAIMHAHSPALVAFSITGQVPDTRISPQAWSLCGEVGYAPYAMTGTPALGEVIAETFEQGYRVILLENHGVVTVGDTLLEAYHRLETLEYCGRIHINAGSLGKGITLSEEQLTRFSNTAPDLPTFQPADHTVQEREARKQVAAMTRRGVRQFLMISTVGTVSIRTGEDAFVITPFAQDRAYLDVESIVLVQDGKAEAGKTPSRAANLHREVYLQHPDVNSIITAQPPYAMTYCVVAEHFDTKTIPESYIMLRDVPVIPYGESFTNPAAIAATISEQTPVALMRNDAIMTVGKTVVEAFDRLEVAEFSARSLLETLRIGELKPMGQQEIRDLEEKFFGK